jgi:hypothetical protein
MAAEVRKGRQAGRERDGKAAIAAREATGSVTAVDMVWDTPETVPDQ